MRKASSLENVICGLLPTIEFADDLSIDVPKAREQFSSFIIAAGFDMAKIEEHGSGRERCVRYLKHF